VRENPVRVLDNALRKPTLFGLASVSRQGMKFPPILHCSRSGYERNRDLIHLARKRLELQEVGTYRQRFFKYVKSRGRDPVALRLLGVWDDGYDGERTKLRWISEKFNSQDAIALYQQRIRSFAGLGSRTGSNVGSLDDLQRGLGCGLGTKGLPTVGGPRKASYVLPLVLRQKSSIRKGHYVPDENPWRPNTGRVIGTPWSNAIPVKKGKLFIPVKLRSSGDSIVK